jgi:hypothetical protein
LPRRHRQRDPVPLPRRLLQWRHWGQRPDRVPRVPRGRLLPPGLHHLHHLHQGLLLPPGVPCHDRVPLGVRRRDQRAGGVHALHPGLLRRPGGGPHGLCGVPRGQVRGGQRLLCVHSVPRGAVRLYPGLPRVHPVPNRHVPRHHRRDHLRQLPAGGDLQPRGRPGVCNVRPLATRRPVLCCSLVVLPSLANARVCPSSAPPPPPSRTLLVAAALRARTPTARGLGPVSVVPMAPTPSSAATRAPCAPWGACVPPLVFWFCQLRPCCPAPVHAPPFFPSFVHPVTA